LLHFTILGKGKGKGKGFPYVISTTRLNGTGRQRRDLRSIHFCNKLKRRFLDFPACRQAGLEMTGAGRLPLPYFALKKGEITAIIKGIKLKRPWTKTR